MNKEFLVILLEKDIRELELLTEGFEDLDTFPKPILQLARQKAENIIKNLHELENINLKNEVKDETLKIEDVKFDVEKNSEDKFLSQIKEFTMEEPETTAPEDTKNDDTADFIEDIEDYGISNKNVIEKDSYETEEKTIIEPIQKKEIEIKPEEEPETIEVKEVNNPIIIENEAELEENAVNTLNSSIKIDDIRTAINIGDRFRFQRELFGGNGEVMNKTFAYLNQLAKFEEAISFLNNKFGWAKDNQHAEDFLQIIKRRYL